MRLTFWLLVLMLLSIPDAGYTQDQEVSYGSTRRYYIDLDKVNAVYGVKKFHWQIARVDGKPLDPGIVSVFPDDDNSDHHTMDVTWHGDVGDSYVITASLEDMNGCYSEQVSLEVIIMPGDALLTFKEEDDLNNPIRVCSYAGAYSSESFEVLYSGAKPWSLHYKLVNPYGDEVVAPVIEYIEDSQVTIPVLIDDFFMNTDNVDQIWRVVLLKAVSEGDSIETLPVEPSQRTIAVHPLPVIRGSISLN